jgi:chlorite dismutase
MIGAPLDAASHVAVIAGAPSALPDDGAWALRGITSYERYVHRPEQDELRQTQPPIGRANATYAALIPIRKSSAWWGLPQDERRRIFEEESHHIRLGMRALPAVARQLHHSRDLGDHEPFDFLTWFEYAESDVAAFDTLLNALRASIEWAYVEREIDIRLVRDAPSSASTAA